MKLKLLKVIILCALFVQGASSAWAQEQIAGKPTPVVNETGGKEVAAKVEPDQWSVQCSASECELYADVRLDNGKIFSTIHLRQLDKDAFVGIIRTPLGIHVPSQIQIGVDRSSAFEAEVITCTSEGCEAAFAASPDVITAFKRGKDMAVVLTTADTRERIALSYSLLGFTKNWKFFLAEQQSRARS